MILGARPNFVKAAPFFHEARKHPEFIFTIMHTGQHFDENMSKIFFEEMGIPAPDIFFSLEGNSYSEKIGITLNNLNNALKADFDGVIVFGDVNSSLAGAIAAAKNHRKVIHIESGLRSHDKRMPEETNRIIIDHLADILFTTEPEANSNLIKEGIAKEKIKYVGDIMIESLELFSQKIDGSKILRSLKLKKSNFIVATIHRQENIENKANFKEILSLLNKINDDIQIILPLHPGTKNKLEEYNLKDEISNIKTIPPLGYFDFINLIKNSKGVVTDSGGIQEETSHLGIPCCTLRDNTERPITIQKGSNKLFSINCDNFSAIIDHLNKKFTARSIPLWDNKVCERIFLSL